MIPAGLAAATPSADAVREAARTVLSRDYYELDNTLTPIALAGRILRWIQRTLDAINDALEGAGLPIPAYVFWALIATVLIGVAAWWLFRWNANRVRTALSLIEAEPEMDDLPTDIEQLLLRSDERAQAGDYVDASRLLYRAALVRLEERRGGFLRRALTTTEYLRTFRAPWVIENLRVFADLINWKWYRDRRFEADDYRRCRDAYDRIDAQLREGM